MSATRVLWITRFPLTKLGGAAEQELRGRHVQITSSRPKFLAGRYRGLEFPPPSHQEILGVPSHNSWDQGPSPNAAGGREERLMALGKVEDHTCVQPSFPQRGGAGPWDQANLRDALSPHF